jgi:hypothetical protein
VESNDPIVVKAKRRIKRQILTEIRQHRVTKISDKLYAYRVKTGEDLLKFRVDSLNRVRLLINK